MTIKIPLIVKGGQWFAKLATRINNKPIDIEYKIDTGCNTITINRDDIRDVGLNVDAPNVKQLGKRSATLASGQTVVFNNIGDIELSIRGFETISLPAVVYPTHNTDNLLGLPFFSRFKSVTFVLGGKPYMKLKQ